MEYRYAWSSRLPQDIPSQYIESRAPRTTHGTRQITTDAKQLSIRLRRESPVGGVNCGQTPPEREHQPLLIWPSQGAP